MPVNKLGEAMAFFLAFLSTLHNDRVTNRERQAAQNEKPKNSFVFLFLSTLLASFNGRVRLCRTGQPVRSK